MMRAFRSHGTGEFQVESLGHLGSAVFEEGVRVWHPETIHIGTNVYVGHDAMLKGDTRGELRIGDDVWIGQGAFLHSAGSIYLDDAVGIGPFVKILTSWHDVEASRARSILDAPIQFAPVRVETDADVGVGAILLPGVTVGKGAQVGAGAVVTRDVPAYAIVAGNPARILRFRSDR